MFSSCNGQNGPHDSNHSITDSTKAYSKAIAEYLKAMDKNEAPDFDTLYIGNPLRMREMKFPATIGGKKIVWATEEFSRKLPDKNNSYILINVAWATFEKDPVEFMVVTFYPGGHPQHNCYIYLNYDPSKGEYTLHEEPRFDPVYQNQKK